MSVNDLGTIALGSGFATLYVIGVRDVYGAWKQGLLSKPKRPA